MLLRLDSCPDDIKGKLVCPLSLLGDGAIVYEGLDILLVLALEHHLKLLPVSVAVISFLGINVEGFQVIYGPGIEDFPVLWMMGGLKLNLGVSQQEFWWNAMLVGKGIVVEYGGSCLGVWGPFIYKWNVGIDVFMQVMCKRS